MNLTNERNRLAAGFVGSMLCLYVALKLKLKKQRHRRRFKTRPINRARKLKSAFVYYKTMKEWDMPQFFKYTRMTAPVFDQLLAKVKPKILRQHRSDEVTAEERLVITLQYLSQGMSMQVLAWNFQMGLSTVHYIIHETCKIIWEILSREYLKCPASVNEWVNIARGFEEKWNFPHCIGALDGKHIKIRAPAKSGSLYYNYKKDFSIVLLASCDSKYCFTAVDVGAYGSQSDGGIFRESIFGMKLDQGTLDIPKESLLEGTDVTLPYYLVADEAFPLKQYIMRPYGGKNLTRTQRIFNYRLSRARQVIENSFGILAARWRILKTSINAKPENIDHIVKAVTVLHNFCLHEMGKGDKQNNIYCPPGYADSEAQAGGWREEENPLQSVGRMGANVAKRTLYDLRDKLAEYLISENGQVPWQNNIVDKGLLFPQ